MIYVIKPSGRRFSDKIKFYYQTILYTIGSTLGSATTGILVAYLGYLLGINQFSYSIFLPISVGLLYALHEFRALRLPMPQRKWQVPVSWINRNKYLGSFFYGLTIGFGVLTYITYTGFYFILSFIFVSGDLSFGALLGAAYGFSRSLSLLSGLFVHKTNESISRFSSIVFMKTRIWQSISGVILLLSALVLIYSFLA